MIFDVQTAKKLEALVHPDIEKAVILLLEEVLRQNETVTEDPNATDVQLRQFQGQKLFVKELKEYRKRLNDAIVREKDGV